jgi:chitodextrinase
VNVTTSANNCTTTPSAPTGLAASGTTSSGTNLSWTAVTPPANCTISSYKVLQNGTSIGTPTGTSFAVSGLSASTAYSFTVEATDANGTSGPSSAVSVTTQANGGGTCATAWNATTAYSQFLDAEPKSRDQQRRAWQWPTLDCDWRLLELLVRASCSDGIGGIWDDAIQH